MRLVAHVHRLTVQLQAALEKQRHEQDISTRLGPSPLDTAVSRLTRVSCTLGDRTPITVRNLPVFGAPAGTFYTAE